MPYKEHHQQLLQQQQQQQQQPVQPEPTPQQVENKVDLKTPSFIPVEACKSQEAEAIEQPKEEDCQIDPDSLDPNINNKENGQTVSDEAVVVTAVPATASTSAGASSKGKGNGKVSKKPRSRHRQKRYTHNEKRYHSEVRQEAVQQALAQMNQSKPVPMPSKRSSVMNKPSNDDGDTEDESSGCSGSDEEGGDDDRDEDIQNISSVTTEGAAVAASVSASENMRNVTLGLSDTSSNNSLARNVNNASNLSETPPLPARNPQPPPSRPPVITSPSRQNSR